MTQTQNPRFWLLATAALVFGSHMSAAAQNTPAYQTGAPTMVAAAPGLPTLSPEQIARDVAVETNPRTGVHELVAAPFDPFEEDPNLAASLRLRSADGAVAMDGRPVRDGAIVEVDFYYNSPSDDPYGGRNYRDAAFVNGELASVVLRDTRIIECSTRVENVVYDHVNYYGSGYSRGVYRPYQHYTGHSGFGFGFGSSYLGPGYGYSRNSTYYGNNRSYRNGFTSSRSRNRRSNARRGSTPRVSDGDRNRDTRNRDSRDRNRDSEDRRRDNDSRRDRRDAGGSRADNREATPRPNASGLTDQQIAARLNRVRSYGVGRSRSDVRRNARASGAQPEVNAQPRIGVRSTAATPAAVTSPQATSSSQTDTRQTRSERRQSRQSEPRQSESRQSETRRSETRGNESNRQSGNRSNSRSSNRSNSRTKKEKSTAPRRRISGNSIKRRLNFFPNDGYGYGGRSVVSTQSVDCAREDKLRVFIPNARLDAARFDGLTLIALDGQGGETPIYLPPNYIEGYRLAATGRVQPQGYQAAPQYGGQQYGGQQPVHPQASTPSPQHRIEPAPCPAGTLKQANGTCLQTGSVGYPR